MYKHKDTSELVIVPVIDLIKSARYSSFVHFKSNLNNESGLYDNFQKAVEISISEYKKYNSREEYVHSILESKTKYYKYIDSDQIVKFINYYRKRNKPSTGICFATGIFNYNKIVNKYHNLNISKEDSEKILVYRYLASKKNRGYELLVNEEGSNYIEIGYNYNNLDPKSFNKIIKTNFNYIEQNEKI